MYQVTFYNKEKNFDFNSLKKDSMKPRVVSSGLYHGRSERVRLKIILSKRFILRRMKNLILVILPFIMRVSVLFSVTRCYTNRARLHNVRLRIV